MKFNFKQSDECRLMFSQARNKEQAESDRYLESLGITKETIIEHRGRNYTNLRACRKDCLDHWQSLVGTRISKDGKLGNTEHIWDTFNIVDA